MNKYRIKKTLILLFFIPMLVAGQEKSFQTGVLFGGSLNSLNENQNTHENYSLTPMGGWVAQYNFTNQFSLKTKLLYHIKGAEGKTGTGNLDKYRSSLNAITDLHYLKMPVLTQFNLKVNRWGVFFNTGVYLGYLINAEHTIGEESFSPDTYNDLDFGLALGSGVTFQLNERAQLFFEASFDRGLKNVSEYKTINNEDFTATTQAITAVFGITYSFKRKRKVFNGMATLDCPDYNETVDDTKKKKTSKWRLVLYKDGKVVGGNTKRGKSRLFK